MPRFWRRELFRLGKCPNFGGVDFFAWGNGQILAAETFPVIGDPKFYGVNGWVVSGRGAYASNSIFLPAAGFGYETSLNGAGSYGYYLSSVPLSGNDYAYQLYFGPGGHDTCSDDRYSGRSVRPVQGFTK